MKILKISLIIGKIDVLKKRIRSQMLAGTDDMTKEELLTIDVWNPILE